VHQVNVRFGSKADITHVFDHLVGDLLEMQWHVEPNAVCHIGSEADTCADLTLDQSRRRERCFFNRKPARGIPEGV